MPYKPELMNALKDDFGDAARKYMESRNHSAAEAEMYLNRMSVIAKDMKYTQRMMDGTLGKEHVHMAASSTRTTT